MSRLLSLAQRTSVLATSGRSLCPTARRLESSEYPVSFRIHESDPMSFPTTHTAGQTGLAVTMKVREGVAVVKFDNKNEKMNSLGEQVQIEIKDIVREIQSSSGIAAAVIISGKTDNFIVGADINMLTKLKTVSDAERVTREAQQMFNDLERSRKPLVSAIMGPALGGGLELAMATHYRIAVNNRKTVLGLPEVMLGLLPGAGGTQRLPRLVPVPDALKMMLMGQQVQAKKAKKLGLVDRLVEPLGPGLKHPDENTLSYLEDVAVAAAKGLVDGSLKVERKKSLMDRILRKALKYKFAQDYVFDQAKSTVMKLTNGLYPAPLKIIEVVRTGIDKGFEEGLAAEARGFAELTQTSHSKALIGLFHGQTQCKKNRFGDPAVKPQRIGVLGAGLMGAGIATVSIDKAGHNVVLKDANHAALQRGQQQIYGVIDGKVKKKRLTSFERDVKLSHLIPTLDYSDFKDVDIVIEAVIEDIKVKHKVLKEIEAVTRPDCIFATNTSAIAINSIAAASARPENVIGMHYFSPVEKMPLLEVVMGEKTSKEAASKAVAVGLKQGKVVITVKDAPAFYTTRVLSFMIAELIHLLLEGNAPQELDKMSKRMGFPVGLVTLLDEVGMDTGLHIQNYLRPIFGDRLSPHDNTAYAELVSQGHTGRKAGKGFYLYDGSKKKGDRDLNPAVVTLLKKYSKSPIRAFSEEEKQMRLLTRFTNEAALCLQEGILANPVEGDIGAVFGLGFPPFRGGPFRYLDTIGADNFLRWMDKFESDFGQCFSACQLIRDHAKDSSKKFHPQK